MQAKLTTANIKSLTPIAKPYEVVDTEVKGFLLRVQPSGRKTFYFSYRNDAKKRQRIKIGVVGPTLTAQQARDKAIIYAGRVNDGVDVQNDKSQRKNLAAKAQDNTLQSFIKNHYQLWVLENLSSGQVTLDRINYSFPDFMGLPLHDITVSLVEKWRTGKIKEGLKASTINRCAYSLSGVLTKAVEWNVIAEHPFKRLKALKIDNIPKVRYLSPDEEKRLFSTLSTRDDDLKQARERGNKHRRDRGYGLLPCLLDCAYADRMTPLITLSLKAGLRRNEAFELMWEDIDFRNNLITVRGEIAKSSNTRHIPLSPLALTTLKAWQKQTPQPDGRVFPADDGGKLDNVKKSWRTILNDAKVGSFRWHDMRHDFASQLVMKGVPLNTVRELCGHADMRTTLRYAHLAPDHKAEAIALLG